MSQFDAMGKMQLVSAVSTAFGIGRNDCLKFTVQSMKDALNAGDSTLLKQGNGEAVNVVTTKGGGLADALGQLGILVDSAIDAKFADFKPGIDAEGIKKLAEEAALAAIGDVRKIHVILPTGVEIDSTSQHFQFPTVALHLGRGRHVWITGPAGTGKSEAALAYGKKAGVPRITLVPMHEDMSVGRLTGYKSPVNGEWIKGDLEDVLTEGGLAILDEIDRCRPGVPVGINSILAQRLFTVNGETRPVHEKAQIVATSNTIHGANGEFTAARQQDKALSDRFLMIKWEADEKFELKLAGSDQREWVVYCQKLRKFVNELGIQSGRVSPRHMIGGAQDLRDGLDRQETERVWIWNRFTPGDEAKLRNALAK